MKTLLKRSADICKWFIYPMLAFQLLMTLILVLCGGDMDTAAVIGIVIELFMIGVIMVSSMYTWLCNKIKSVH